MQEAIRKRRAEQETTVNIVNTASTVDNAHDANTAHDVNSGSPASNVDSVRIANNDDNVDNAGNGARNTGVDAGVVDDGSGEPEGWFHRHFRWMFGDK